MSSYRTYEEWKHNAFAVTSKSLDTVLTVPMRNGNYVFDPRLGYVCVGSYRTYEEWKPTEEEW